MAWSWSRGAGGAASGAATGAGFGLPGIAVGGVLGGLMGLLGGGDGKKKMSPELERLINQQVSQTQAANPLYEQILQSAYSRLPAGVRSGAGPNLDQAMNDQATAAGAARSRPGRTPSEGTAVARTGGLPGVASAALNGGDFSESNAVRYLLRQQEIRQRMAQPVIDAVMRLAQSRMPRRGARPPAAPRLNTGGV